MCILKQYLLRYISFKFYSFFAAAVKSLLQLPGLFVSSSLDVIKDDSVRLTERTASH